MLCSWEGGGGVSLAAANRTMYQNSGALTAVINHRNTNLFGPDLRVNKRSQSNEKFLRRDRSQALSSQATRTSRSHDRMPARKSAAIR